MLTVVHYQPWDKKGKRESKKVGDTPTKKSSHSSSLIDPSSVAVVGAVDDQGMLQSPGSSCGDKKRRKLQLKKKIKPRTVKHTKSSSEKPS